MALMLLRVLAAARLLDLSGFAQFSAGLLVSSSLGMLGCFGVYAVLQRDMPMMIVRGRERRAAVLMSQATLAATILTALALSAIGLGWSVAKMPHAVTVAGVLHGFAQQLFLIGTVESRSRGEPLRFALQMLVRAAGVAAIGLFVLAWLQSPVCALLAEALASVLLARSILGRAYKRTRLGFKSTIYLSVRRIAFVPWSAAIALLSVSLVGFVAQFSDRWIAAELLDASGFALYSFAWTLPLIGQSVQVIVNAAVFPLIARRHAMHGTGQSFRITAALSIGLAVLGALLALPAGWALSTAVLLWLPAYQTATPLLLIFLVVTVLRVSDFWTTYLTVAGHEQILLVINLAATTGTLALWALLYSPWDAPALSPMDVAVLAPMITAATYVATAIAAIHRHSTSQPRAARPRT